MIAAASKHLILRFDGAINIGRDKNMANLTNKELAAIKDQMTAEQTLICKYNVYAKTINDEHLSCKCKEIAQKHQEHYNKLMSMLS